MLRATTLLIVTVLASGPIGSLACELWCASPAEPHQRTVGCHEPSRDAPADSQIAARGRCHEAVATAVFLIEIRALASAADSAAAPLPESGSMYPDARELAPGGRVFQVPPSHGRALSTVLRI
jgi:hypothetical protein